MLKLLAAGGYVVALSGAGFTSWYLSRPKNLREAISKVDTLSTTEKHFTDTWQLFRHDEEFMNWVISSNPLNFSSPTLDKDAAEIVKGYCKEVLDLPLFELTIKEILPRARTYCTVPKYTKKKVSINNGSTWREITEAVKYKGTNQDTKIFLVATDYAQHGHGRMRQIFYCWDNDRKDWDIKKEGELCS